MMNKISAAEAGQMMKLAAENLRALSEAHKTVTAERDDALQKVAHYEHVQRVEKVAKVMHEKGLNPELSYEEKVASISQHEKLDVLEEAVGMSAPQLKLASVSEDGGQITVEGSDSDAANTFAASLINDD